MNILKYILVTGIKIEFIDAPIITTHIGIHSKRNNPPISEKWLLT